MHADVSQVLLLQVSIPHRGAEQFIVAPSVQDVGGGVIVHAGLLKHSGSWQSIRPLQLSSMPLVQFSTAPGLMPEPPQYAEGVCPGQQPNVSVPQQPCSPVLEQVVVCHVQALVAVQDSDSQNFVQSGGGVVTHALVELSHVQP